MHLHILIDHLNNNNGCHLVCEKQKMTTLYNNEFSLSIKKYLPLASYELA